MEQDAQKWTKVYCGQFLQHNFFNMVAGNIKVHVNEGEYKTAANSDYNSFMKILRIFNFQSDIAALN